MIVLFDVDGVLVENRAYRASIQQTSLYFGRRLGLGTRQPSNSEIDVFEAESITVEWDSCAIVAATLLLERLRAEAGSVRRRARLVGGGPRDFWQLLDELPARKLNTAAIDFRSLARRVGAAARETGRLPARAALELFREDLAQQTLVSPAVALPLLEHLLGHVYDIDASPAMQVFQNFVLGDEQYLRYYGLPPRVTGAGLIDVLDRPLLRPDLCQVVLARRSAGTLFPVIFTARPSLTPVEVSGFERGYTPESEIARGLVGLEGVPVLGFGKLDWFARHVGRTGSELVKPSPVHAMAAIGAARSGLELEAIKAAVAVERGDNLRYPLTACAGESVHVFEDSPSSLRAAAIGVELLNRQGLGLHLTRHGVAPAGSPKRETLAGVADSVHADVNEGLVAILRV
jgi:hypothetical protein